VLPPDFVGPVAGRSFDVAVPFGTEPLVRGLGTELDARSTWWLDILARLRPGQTIGEATRALRGVQPQIRAATTPEHWTGDLRERYLSEPFTLVPAATGVSHVRSRYRQPLLAMMAVVGLVLLIACANIANLQLARAHARRHELSLRQALGASRSRVARQLLAESLLLAAIGSVAGLVFARWASGLLVAQLSTFEETIALDLSIDWRVLVFTAAVAVATALFFGLAPALRAGRLDALDALTEGGRGAGGVTRRRAGDPLIVVQVACSLVLVVCAGLFTRTFITLARLDPGFDPDPVLLVAVDAQHSRVQPADRPALLDRARAAAASVPGVARAAASLITPVGGRGWNDLIQPTAGTNLSERERLAWFNAVSPGWFATYRTTLLSGRDFDGRDARGAPPVAIVNQAYARRFLRGANPVGDRVRLAPEPDRTISEMQVVGLVEDAAHRSLRDPMAPVVYVPLAQSANPNTSSVVISVQAARGLPPAMLARGVAQAIARVDTDLSLQFLPLREQVDAGLVRERLMAMLSAFFGGLALLLSGIGLYGIASTAVSLRRTEIGIRMALGANSLGVQRMVIARVALLVGAGLALGTAVSLWAARFIASLLFGLEPRDPATLAAATAALFAVALFAAWLPARRASRVDPAAVLREG
jgi:predicted permease